MILAEIASRRWRRQRVGLAEAEQRVELLALEALALFARLRIASIIRRSMHHVAQAVGHPRIGGQAVAAGAAGFLVIALDALGQIEVRDEAHVGLVDAHAEGDGGDHHDALLAQEALLVARCASAASRPAW